MRGLEWQYNPRASTMEVDAYQKRASERSRRARSDIEVWHSNVPYGSGEDEKVDIFPARMLDGPTHVFFHGGYWRGRDKADYSFLAPAFRDIGINLIVANYSLCPKVRLSDIVSQTSRLLTAVPKLAQEHGMDPGRFTASGHSAGAHLLAAALAGATGASSPPGGVKAVTLISGIYDLEPVLSISINETIGLSANEIDDLSPMRQAVREDVAHDVVAGTGETPGWISQSTRFAEHCQIGGAPAELVLSPADHHYSIMEQYADAKSPLMDRIARLSDAA